MTEHMNGYTCEDVEDALLDVQKALAERDATITRLRDVLIVQHTFDDGKNYSQCRVCEALITWFVNEPQYQDNLGHKKHCPVPSTLAEQSSPISWHGGDWGRQPSPSGEAERAVIEAARAYVAAGSVRPPEENPDETEVLWSTVAALNAATSAADAAELESMNG